MEEAERIARGLSEAERTFLYRVIENTGLPHADRKEDRARQKCRRAGLVYIAKNPRRWEALPLGQQVRAILLRDKG